MKKHSILIVCLGSLLLLYGTANATTWYVHPDSALNTIQAGLDSCADNDTVLVGPGTYVENIVWPNTQGIHLISELGPDATIIDGDSAGNVIVCATGVDTTTAISGFTIQNGNSGWGGGIYCMYSSPLIIGNKITGNTAHQGGGILCYTSNATIRNNTIINNTAGAGGGGVHCIADSSTLTGNTFANNEAGRSGGALVLFVSAAFVSDNVITNNSADNGGGISAGGGLDTIVGNIISNNSATCGGGLICGSYIGGYVTVLNNTITGNTADYGGGIAKGDCDMSLKCNTISGNTAYTCGGGIATWGVGTITMDSCIVSHNNIHGLYCYGADSVVIHFCNIFNNTGYGVGNEFEPVTVNAEDNWWGDSTGPYHAVTNLDGLGDTVSDYVDFDPWLLEPVPIPGIEEHESIQQVATTLKIFPNPFSKLTKISFGTVRGAKSVELKIYDATGRVVKEFNHLTHNLIFWNGTDDFNRQLPSGVYFLEFQAGDYSATEKLLLIR